MSGGGGGGGMFRSNPGSREIVLNIKSSVCHDIVSIAEKIYQTTVLCDHLDRRTPCPQVEHVGHTTCKANTYQTFEGVNGFCSLKNVAQFAFKREGLSIKSRSNQ